MIHLRVARLVALGLAMAILSTAAAQPPRGTAESKKDAPKPTSSVKTDKAVDDWVKVLAEKMTDRHDGVRESARAALAALGDSALPALKKLAESDDSATALAAKNVIARIDGGPRGGFAGFTPFGGIGGMA